MGPLGLYLHIPFCHSKCGYCDFYSVALHDRPTRPLVEAVVRELAVRLAERPGRIGTIFVGGGTPTVLPPEDLRLLMAPLADTAGRDQVAEFTVEANPGTVSAEVLHSLTESRVDRISMGAQSFHQDELATLERLHSPADIAPAVALCRAHGVRRLNLDLIFGIPGQTLARWRDSLRRAIDLGPDHVSCYGLTYEPATALTALRDAGRIAPCDEDLEADMYLATLDDLADAGYEQYEISNFAKPGERCRHNMIYWRNEPYIGVGPSAAGYLEGARYKNVAGIEAYLRAVAERGRAVVESERIAGRALAGETAMLQLRLNDGIRFRDFKTRTGFDAREVFAASIERHRLAKLLRVTDEGVALTREGSLVADAVIADFMAEAAIDVGSRKPEVGTSYPLSVLPSDGRLPRSEFQPPSSHFAVPSSHFA